MGDFQGKVALVTGAGSGIGRATALAFAAAGAQVACVDRDAKSAEATVAAIQAAGGAALMVAADVTKDADAARMVAETVAAFGGLDAAHNNAGIEGALAPLDAYPEDAFDAVMAVNVKGVWLSLKHQLPELRKRRGAAVNTASIAGLKGSARTGAYTASKHAVVGLTRVAALENATLGVRVNAVCPGVIETPMTERATTVHPKMRAALTAQHPIGRLGTADEVAAAVLWLCSPHASFVTGQALGVDGGWGAL